MEKETKIAVALSGGVDSATTAALLKEKGYFVAGFFMQNWSSPIDKRGFCPTVADVATARMVAHQLKIPFYVLDFEKEYYKKVIEPFLNDYRKGLTPNPDVLCNKFIKFGLFLETAKKLGFEKIATGHYALIKEKDGVFHLYKGIDRGKDQSYFLWTLTRKELGLTLFPVGGFYKKEIRLMACKRGLINAHRKDSQGICFIGPIEVSRFLQRFLPKEKGPVRDENGKILGYHQGVWFYTIGQREGLGISGTVQPLYVAYKDVRTNSLYVVPREHPWLFAKEFKVRDTSFVQREPKEALRVEVVIRYHSQPLRASLFLEGGQFSLVLDEPAWAVTEGQSAVFYQEEELLGGGIIDKVLQIRGE